MSKRGPHSPQPGNARNNRLSQQSTLTVVGTGPADKKLNRNLNGKVDGNVNGNLHGGLNLNGNQKMELNWNQIGTKMVPTWNQTGTQMGPKLEPKWHQSGTKTGSLGDPWRVPGSSLEGPWGLPGGSLWKPRGSRHQSGPGTPKVFKVSNSRQKQAGGFCAGSLRYQILGPPRGGISKIPH